MDASLPAQCREDLEFLRRTVRALAPAVAPDRFSAVFLTGATGFVARLERIRRAMLAAEIWDDAFAARIVVHAGDIGEPRFGLDAGEFAVMRLPQTGIAASTGYTQSSHVKVRIATAVLDTGLPPAGVRHAVDRVTDPVRVAASIYREYGWTLDETTRATVERSTRSAGTWSSRGRTGS